MKIQITIKNVSRTFLPDQKALLNLVIVVESAYHSSAEVTFETALSFRVSSDGKIIPTSPTEVLVYEDASDGKRTYMPRSFSSRAGLINKKIQDLLLVSNLHDLNLPASVKIQAGGKKYKFLGLNPVVEQEWRES